jgi:hypothetical protein
MAQIIITLQDIQRLSRGEFHPIHYLMSKETEEGLQKIIAGGSVKK